MCLISFKCDAKSKAWDILLVLTSVAENLCNKCPSGYSNKTAVKVILSMRSLVSIEQQSPRRPCDIKSPRPHCLGLLRDSAFAMLAIFGLRSCGPPWQNPGSAPEITVLMGCLIYFDQNLWDRIPSRVDTD